MQLMPFRTQMPGTPSCPHLAIEERCAPSRATDSRARASRPLPAAARGLLHINCYLPFHNFLT
eukprot:2103895-Pleurochrysis_carterae.AAC.1